MKKILKKLKFYSFFIIFRSRIFTRNKTREIAESVKGGERVLEIGSGWIDKKGDYYFSSSKYFNNKNVDFVMSDINPSFRNKVVDAENFSEKEAYDHILCFHVLDDVYDWQKAFLNLHNAIKPEGFLHVILPMFIPLDLRVDYFRFTEVLLREFCKRNNIKIDKFETHGFKSYPFNYYLRIKK